MARLNELPMMADSLETLRRKFLRQNRDIARVNSNQSLRIRGLENECARLLSENLELRSQVLRMEKELKDSSAQRVAEHALLVKEKMEAQLVELGALLAGFGLEPPAKKQSPQARRPKKTTKPLRLSQGSEGSASPLPQKKTLSPSEIESLAAHEGRLPPIFESKTYPRQTLSGEEILALRTNTADAAAGSPELGPPPISRMLQDQSRKSAGSPSKAAVIEGEVPALPPVDNASDQPAANTPAPVKATAHATSKNAHRQKSNEPANIAPPTSISSAPMPSVSIPKEPATTPAQPVSKAGSKRKFAVNDENAVIRGMKTVGSTEKPKPVPVGPGHDAATKGLSVRELKNPRSIRELVGSRREAKENGAGVTTPSGARRPLSIKSSNDDLSSPRKCAVDEAAKPKMETSAPVDTTAAGGRMRDRAKMRVMADALVQPPPLLPPSVAERDVNDTEENIPTTPVSRKRVSGPVGADSEPPLASEQDAVSPSTPLSTATGFQSSSRSSTAPTAGAGGRDTPPPADFCARGEASRPSRRSRSSVSYAEPNLRDKMRRPTKELFDAVAGEGKYVQRQSIQHQQHNNPGSEESDQHPPLATPSSSSSMAGRLPLTDNVPKASSSQPMTAADRRKRATSLGPREAMVGELRAVDLSDRASSASSQKASSAKSGPLPAQQTQDPYEFTLSSSPQSFRSSEAGEGGGGSSTQSASEGDADADVDADADDDETRGVKSRSGSGRKSAAGPRVSQTRATRRSSAAGAAMAPVASRLDDSAGLATLVAADRHTRPSAARKRTSMVALKKASSLLNDDDDDDNGNGDEDPADSSYEPPSVGNGVASDAKEEQSSEGRTMSTRDRISRRRSMML